jgi:hypothetical protein
LAIGFVSHKFRLVLYRFRHMTSDDRFATLASFRQAGMASFDEMRHRRVSVRLDRVSVLTAYCLLPTAQLASFG